MNAVAQNRDTLREFENLRQTMTDIDYAGAAGGQSSNEFGELAHAIDVKRRGRLIEEQDFGIREQRLDDFNELTLRGRQRSDCRSRIRVNVESLQLFLRPWDHASKRDGSGRSGEKQVLRDRQFADKRIVLIDRRQAEAMGETRVRGRQSRASDLHDAAIGNNGSAGDLINVLLPEPFSPSTACTSPARQSMLKRSNARTPG